jgi:DNA-binding NarL/FixJ family response regulator
MLLARYPVVCAGLRRFLETHDGLCVVGECAQTADAIALNLRESVDIVLIDTDSDEVSLRAVSDLAKACQSRILVFTHSTDPDVCTRAIQLGASGVVSKDQPRELLIRAVLKVHAGELWLDRAKAAMVLSHAMHRDRDPEIAKIESLTKREREIVALVGEGLRNTAIAERLFISEATVRNHLTSVLSKLGLADRFELAVYAFRHELVERPEAVALRRHLWTANGGAPPRQEAADAAILDRSQGR